MKKEKYLYFEDERIKDSDDGCYLHEFKCELCGFNFKEYVDSYIDIGNIKCSNSSKGQDHKILKIILTHLFDKHLDEFFEVVHKNFFLLADYVDGDLLLGTIERFENK